MNKIAIQIALEEEISEFNLADYPFVETPHGKLYFLSDNVCLIFSGVGKVRATSTATFICERFKDELLGIINLGSCGTHKPDVKVLDTFLVNKFTYVDNFLREEQINELDIPLWHQRWFKFANDNKLANTLKTALDFEEINYRFGFTGTGDSFVTQNNVYRFNQLDNVDIIEMEACAIAEVCKIYNKDFIALKIVTDSTHSHETNEDQFYSNLKVIHKTLSAILRRIIS